MEEMSFTLLPQKFSSEMISSPSGDGVFFGKFAFYISQLMYCALLVIDWLIDWGKKIRDKWFSPTLVLLGK